MEGKADGMVDATDDVLPEVEEPLPEVDGAVLEVDVVLPDVDVVVVPLPGASTGTGVSSACNFDAAITWRRIASTSGCSKAALWPTHLASIERSSSTPSRA